MDSVFSYTESTGPNKFLEQSQIVPTQSEMKTSRSESMGTQEMPTYDVAINSSYLAGQRWHACPWSQDLRRRYVPQRLLSRAVSHT